MRIESCVWRRCDVQLEAGEDDDDDDDDGSGSCSACALLMKVIGSASGEPQPVPSQLCCGIRLPQPRSVSHIPTADPGIQQHDFLSFYFGRHYLHVFSVQPSTKTIFS